jgi:hypothetical protein
MGISMNGGREVIPVEEGEEGNLALPPLLRSVHRERGREWTWRPPAWGNGGEEEGVG